MQQSSARRTATIRPQQPTAVRTSVAHIPPPAHVARSFACCDDCSSCCCVVLPFVLFLPLVRSLSRRQS